MIRRGGSWPAACPQVRKETVLAVLVAPAAALLRRHGLGLLHGRIGPVETRGLGLPALRLHEGRIAC